ncbi:hypothetical protein BDAP_000206 [Binucleata daphniae]
MPQKDNIYLNTVLLLSFLVLFVFTQIFFMFPRSIIYEEGFFSDNKYFIVVNNKNYRNIRLKLYVESGNKKWTVRSSVDRLSSSKIEIGRISNDVVIKDNFMNKNVFKIQK